MTVLSSRSFLVGKLRETLCLHTFIVIQKKRKKRRPVGKTGRLHIITLFRQNDPLGFV